MSEPEKKDARYVVILTNGAAENAKAGHGYYDILADALVRVQHAGGQDALPNMLMRNGKVIILHGLHNIAWKYGEKRRAIWNAAEKELRDAFPEPPPPILVTANA
jgi:hypothetical protein